MHCQHWDRQAKSGRIKKPGFFQRTFPLGLVKVLASMATDSEAEASRMKARYQNCPGLYHRLNVERGLEEVSLQEWEKLADVKTRTMEYLQADDIDTDIDIIVNALVGRSSKSFRLGQSGTQYCLEIFSFTKFYRWSDPKSRSHTLSR